MMNYSKHQDMIIFLLPGFIAIIMSIDPFIKDIINFDKAAMKNST